MKKKRRGVITYEIPFNYLSLFPIPIFIATLLRPAISILENLHALRSQSRRHLNLRLRPLDLSLSIVACGLLPCEIGIVSISNYRNLTWISRFATLRTRELEISQMSLDFAALRRPRNQQPQSQNRCLCGNIILISNSSMAAQSPSHFNFKTDAIPLNADAA